MRGYNPWPEGGRAKSKTARRRKAHSGAAHIGWGYRSDRKRGAKSPLRYLAAAGLSRPALKRYRSARKTPAKTLFYKRTHRTRKTGRPRGKFITRPFLVNRRARHNRRAGTYARFVGAFARRTGLRGPSLMRSAARAWHSGRHNADPFPMTNRRKARRNQQPGLVYFNRKRRKTSRNRSRRNGILPQFAFENRKRRRGRARRNGILQYAAFNRGYRRNRARGGAEGVLDSFTEGIETIFRAEFWTENVLPLGAGFIGAQFAGGMVQSLAEKVMGKQTGIVGSIQRIGSRALGGVVVSSLSLLITKDTDVASKVLAGGLVAVFAAILQEIFGADTYSKMTGVGGLGMFGAATDSLTEELKARIARSVQSEIAQAEGSVQGVSAFVSTQDMALAPRLGPGPRMQGVDGHNMGSFVTTQELRTAPVASQGGAPMVADLSSFSDSFADLALI